MSVTIVLAEGFDGDDVELTVDGRTHVMKAARTSPLTGMADELVVGADAGPVRVSARLAPSDASPAGGAVSATPTAEPSYVVPLGATLVLDRTVDGLGGHVLTGPVGYG